MTDLITTPETFTNFCEQLLDVIPADTFRVWFDNMRVGRIDDDGCELIAPNEFSAIWIRDNYLDVIRQEADRLVGRPYSVDLLGDIDENDDSDVTVGRLNKSGGKNKKSVSRLTGPALQGRSLGINPKILSLILLLAVAVNWPLYHVWLFLRTLLRYNPATYGETGLGKTHLMHAVAYQALNRNPSCQIHLYHVKNFTT